jgi:hypothetical protein
MVRRNKSATALAARQMSQPAEVEMPAGVAEQLDSPRDFSTTAKWLQRSAVDGIDCRAARRRSIGE